MRTIILKFTLIFLLSVLGGCAFMRKDLALVSMEAVKYREQHAEFTRTLAPDGFNRLGGHLAILAEQKGDAPITPKDVELYFEKHKRKNAFKDSYRRKYLLLKVRFSSKANLYEYSKKSGYTLFFNAYFCNESPYAKSENISWGSLYWNGLNLTYSYAYNYEVAQKEDEPYIYYGFLYVLDDYSDPSSYERSPLLSNPNNICFSMKGSTKLFAIDSNVVVIPKAEIIKVLDQKMPSRPK